MYCESCGPNVTATLAGEVNDTALQQTISCSKCREQVSATAPFCWRCGNQLNGSLPEKVDQSRKAVVVVVCICVAVMLAYLAFFRTSRSAGGGSNASGFERNFSSMISNEPDPNKLTKTKVEEAVGRLTSNLRVSGSIVVEGIRELPQENAARADLRFVDFKYKSDMAGTPLSNDKQAPKKPNINDPNFYDQMYKFGTQQVQTRSYSGQGFAVLEHYSDERWVLKEVHWEFNGWSGNVDVR